MLWRLSPTAAFLAASTSIKKSCSRQIFSCVRPTSISTLPRAGICHSTLGSHNLNIVRCNSSKTPATQYQNQSIEDMPAEIQDGMYEKINKARKHTGAPLTNLVGNDEENEKAGVGVGIALILVDVINDINFEGNEFILEQANKMAPKIHKLMEKCRETNMPIIYCNDNFGKWRSSLEHIYDHVIKSDSPGKSVAEILKPNPDDYFVLKPKHSAFYATALDSLLTYLQVKTLIIVGMAGNVCINATANDAFMRDFAIFVPKDCIASTSLEESEAALLLMERVLRTTTTPSDELDIDELIEIHRANGGKVNHRKRKAQQKDKKEGMPVNPAGRAATASSG
ncbi:Isochorismatase-like protein [Phlyctochytrium arcticum]|nr:Isochorismatase-like protein [Phlyctochytrium arcticum]